MDAINDVPPAIANGVGVVTLLGLLFWMLATDRLITGPAHRRELAGSDRVVAMQAETIADQKKVIEVKDDQLEKLAVIGETQIKMLASIDALARERRET